MDYPKVGVWSDGYYVGFNTFDAETRSFLYGEVMVMERDQMIQGLPAQSVRFQNGSFSTPYPADIDGPLPPEGVPAPFANVSTNRVQLFELDVEWEDPEASTFQPLAILATAPFDFRSDPIPQPGTTDLLASLGTRGMFRLQYRNRGTHGTLMFNHTVDVDGVAGVRWYEMRDGSANGWNIYQQGTFAPEDGLHRWMGSIAMNGAGDIGIGYSVSSPTVFPSIRFAGQSADMSGTGLLDLDEVEVHTGTGSQIGTSGRWGDYTHLAIDPTDDATFWYTSEYYEATGSFDFRTRVAQIEIQDLAPPVLSFSPPALRFELEEGTADTQAVTVSNSAALGSARLSLDAFVDGFEVSTPEAASGPLAGAEAGQAGRRCENGEQLAQRAFTSVGVVASGGRERGQSFQAPCSGLLARISPYFDRSSAPTAEWTAVMRVYEGAGTSGRELAAVPFSFNNASTLSDVFFVPVEFPDEVEVRAGDTYTWFLDMTGPDASTTGMQFTNLNALPDASTFLTNNGDPEDAVEVPTDDMRFQMTFSSPSVWATSTPGRLSLEPGESGEIDVTADATDLPIGTYTATLRLVSSNAGVPGAGVPVTLNVVDETDTEATPEARASARLHAPIPNPVRDLTTVPFTLDTPGFVSLSVYDVQGREVAQLAEGLFASGDHVTTWSASAAAPGVYVIRMVAADRVFTQRAVVVR